MKISFLCFVSLYVFIYEVYGYIFYNFLIKFFFLKIKDEFFMVLIMLFPNIRGD